jgi:L-asparaginase type I
MVGVGEATMSKKKDIRIIYVGGTIGAEINVEQETKLIRGKKLRELLLEKRSDLSHWCDLKINEPLGEPILGEDIVPDDWITIAKAVAKEINSGADGIVIAHGTDTMPFTSSAMTFMLKEVPIPVISTGSRLPLNHMNTDAIQNLYDSIVVAGSDELAAGVYVLFPNKDNTNTIYVGNRIKQIRPFTNYFDSPPSGQIGYINNNKIRLTKTTSKKQNIEKNEFSVYTELDVEVAFFRIYPGFQPMFIEYAIERKIKAILLDIYHSGTVCTRDIKPLNLSLIPSIINAVSKGVLVFTTPPPRVDLPYPSSKKLEQAGVSPLPPMTSEAALVKLMCILKRATNENEIKYLMNKDIAGEIWEE